MLFSPSSSDRANHRRLPNLSFLLRLRRYPIRKRRTSPLATLSTHLLGSSQTVCVPRQPPLIYSSLSDTHVIWGVNLGQDNITAAFLEAKAIIRAFHAPAIKSAGIVLDAIEIGNEADLYMNNGARPKTYTSAQYVKEYML